VDVDIDLGFGVWLKDERVRLSGIDAPESRTSDGVEKIFGLLAKSKVEELCPVGSVRYLRTTAYDSKGKFGRIIGDIVHIINWGPRNEISVCDILLKEGHAVVYNAENKALIESAHLANRVRLVNEGIVTQEQIDAVNT
jgi:endonuclease YncB( thermonuclease family)